MKWNYDEVYQTIFDSTLVAVGITDLNGCYIEVNPAWSTYMGYSAEEAKSLCIDQLTTEDQKCRSSENFAALCEGKIDNIHITRKYLRKDGSSFWTDVYVSPLKDKAGKPVALIAFIVDIDRLVSAEAELDVINKKLTKTNTALQKAVEDLTHLASYDTLTHLMNRRVLAESLDREILRCKRSKSGLGIALCDIDDFKKVNDTYGHDVGDIVLVECARIMKEQVRGTDYVGRWGGEEFLFILPDTNPRGAHVVIERIRKKIEKMSIPLNGATIKLTASFGLSFEYKDFDPKEMIEHADKALYEAKNSGKNRVIIYKEA
ncbi:MAG TPA: diguanylate cyclase [Candidatus Cloacimonetes bacterium]|nr:diguanylate cyclase [Candidatus Cloacimonadota bacterium]